MGFCIFAIMAYKENEIEEIFKKILFKISFEGMAIRNILKDKDMPSTDTFFKWLDNDESKTKQYARACELRADTLFEEIIEIADDKIGDTILNKDGEPILNTEFVQRSRLKVDARKWAASKLNPKKYGDKQEIKLEVTEIKPLEFKILE